MLAGGIRPKAAVLASPIFDEIDGDAFDFFGF